MSTIITSAAIRDLLRGGNFDAFLGAAENAVFEAKGRRAYDVSEAKDRYELAKDVVSFCNSAAGGYIVVGLVTEKAQDQALDLVTATELVPDDARRRSELGGVVASMIYPKPAGLSIEWHPSSGDRSTGLIAIEIPPQPEELRPFVILRVDEDGATLKAIVIGYAERTGADSVPFEGKTLQQALRRGLDGTSRRLTRVEGQLDELLRRTDPQASIPDEAAADALIAERLAAMERK